MAATRLIFITVLAAFVAGCAINRYHLDRNSFERFELGKATYADVVTGLGEPLGGPRYFNSRWGVPLKRAFYFEGGFNDPVMAALFRTEGGTSEPSGSPDRTMEYYFSNDILVGKRFQSSFRSDSTDFDTAKVRAIEKGRTKRDDVARLLGRPTALYIKPMVAEGSAYAIGYDYSFMKERASPFTKPQLVKRSLRVSFTDSDYVSDIELVQ